MKFTMMAAAVAMTAGMALGQVTPGTQPGTQPGSTPGSQPGQTQPGRTQPGMNRPGQPVPRDMQPGMGRDLTQKQLTQADIDQFTQGWPQDHIQAVKTLTAKYGQPNSGSSMAIVWVNPGQYKRIIVHKDEAQHLFPMEHKDFVESVIAMKVPQDKVDDLVKFDGSLAYNRTKGELSATCDKEENNLVALNLAHDIVTDAKSVDEARDFLTKTAQQVQNGEKADYASSLQFRPDLNAADPDRPGRVLGAPESPMRDNDKDQGDKPGGLDKDDNKNSPYAPKPRNQPETPRR